MGLRKDRCKECPPEIKALLRMEEGPSPWWKALSMGNAMASFLIILVFVAFFFSLRREEEVYVRLAVDAKARMEEALAFLKTKRDLAEEERRYLSMELGRVRERLFAIRFGDRRLGLKPCPVGHTQRSLDLTLAELDDCKGLLEQEREGAPSIRRCLRKALLTLSRVGEEMEKHHSMRVKVLKVGGVVVILALLVLTVDLGLYKAVGRREVRLLRDSAATMLQALLSLAKAVEARDPYTHGHSERVAEYAEAIARRMGWSMERAKLLRFAGLLHDIGKIGVPDHILLKEGPLTQEEWTQMRMHPMVGAEILAPMGRIEELILWIRHHHERWDGEGYPDGLSGEEIPDGARILAVADAFEAMTSDRPYRRALPSSKALAVLKEGAGSQWDPEVVRVALGLFQTLEGVGGEPLSLSARGPA